MDTFEFARILGSLLYDMENAGSFWGELSEESRGQFISQLESDGFAGFLRLSFQEAGILSETLDKRLMLKNAVRLRQAVLDEFELKSLYAFLESEKVRFCPIKGIDLAFRVYPSPSLRPYGDWDILFHPEDIDRVRHLMMERGWEEVVHKDAKSGHHYSPLVKGRFFMEPHWTLSCFYGADALRIWDYMLPQKEGGFRYTLSPELNLLLIARHASEWNYREVALSKLLLDAAMVIRHDDVDWRKLREIARELNQPYAGNLFAAFPEFFPKEMVERMEAEPEQCGAYREIFAHRGEFKKVEAKEVMMEEDNRFSLQWFKRALAVFHPKNLRYKYGLPLTGETPKLLRLYFVEMGGKISKALWGLFGRKTPGFREYLDTIRKAEYASKSPRVR